MLEKSWAERNGFPDWALAIGWIFIAFVVSQIFVAIVFGILLAIRNVDTGVSFESTFDLLVANLDLFFIGNTAGQFLFFALATWFVCRLQVNKQERNAFLRFKANKRTILFTAIALLSIICIQPFVWFLGWINSLLPVPEFFDSLQFDSAGLLHDYITDDTAILLVLFHIAVVPAVCEEILFRGYVLRSFQESWGYIVAIIVSGIIFGAFHLQLAHLLPLAAIGILLGYLTWASESIIPAMAAHFLNNAGSVFLVRFYPNSEMANTTATTLPPVSLVIISTAITALLLYFLHKNRAVNA